MTHQLPCQMCGGRGILVFSVCPACEGDGERRVESRPERLVLSTDNVAMLVMDRSVGR